MPQYDIDTNQFDGTDYRNREVLLKLYWHKDLSSRDIATIFNVSKKTILRWMKRHDIPRRQKRTAGATFYMNNGRQKWAVNEKDGTKVVRVARLTAVAKYGFDAVCENDVHHKNHVPWLDYVENLEILSPSEHGRRHNLGQNNPDTELSAQQVKEIKRELSDGKQTQQELAEQYGVTQSAISDISRGATWSQIG